VSGLSYKQDVNRRQRWSGVRDGAGVQTWPGGAGVTELKETGVGGDGVEREASLRRRLKRFFIRGQRMHALDREQHAYQAAPVPYPRGLHCLRGSAC
jgi:hypothetical protein